MKFGKRNVAPVGQHHMMKAHRARTDKSALILGLVSERGCRLDSHVRKFLCLYPGSWTGQRD
jgi:hypothetical protein